MSLFLCVICVCLCTCWIIPPSAQCLVVSFVSFHLTASANCRVWQFNLPCYDNWCPNSRHCSCLGCEGFRFWRKTDKNWPLWRKYWFLTKLVKFGICGRFFWRNLHSLMNEKWHFWRRNPLEPTRALAVPAKSHTQGVTCFICVGICPVTSFCFEVVDVNTLLTFLQSNCVKGMMHDW